MARSSLSGMLLLGAIVLGTPFYMGESCGLEENTKVSGEPCTRDRECELGLSCIGGVCAVAADGGIRMDSGPEPRDAGRDTEPVDAHRSDADLDSGPDGRLVGW